jgi:hypothetical protein
VKHLKIIFRTFFLLSAVLLTPQQVLAEEKDEDTPLDSVEVSLLTCQPHDEVYSLSGHTALRWHDLKRYGIEITHRQGSNPTQKLLWNDDRRAIQLPQEVILAGMAANPRVIVGDHVGSGNAGGIYVPTQPMVTTAVEASTLGAQLTRENND